MKRAVAIAVLLVLVPFLAFADDSSSNSTSGLFANLFQGCWTCGAFNTVGAIGLSFADQAFTKVSAGLTVLIGLFMALWVLYFAAKLLLPFGPPGAAHWNVGATKLFKLLFVLAFLQSSGPFWNYVFTPVLSTALGLASQLATAADEYETKFGTTQSMPGGTGTAAIDYCTSSPPDTGVTLSDNTTSALAALEQMDCPLSRIQSQYAKGILIGVSVMGQAKCPDSKSFFNLLPDQNSIAYLAAGIILVLLFGFGFMVFPFLLLDVLMRVILVAVTSPLAIASILFKPTEKIAGRSLWTLAQSGLTLMFGAAIAGIGKAMMAYILKQMASLPNGPALADWSSLTTALEKSCSSNFEIDFSNAAFYMLCGTALLMIFMMRRANSLAAELTGVAGSVGATAAGAAVLGAAAGAAGRVGQMAANYTITRTAASKASQVSGNADKGGGNRSNEVSGNKQK